MKLHYHRIGSSDFEWVWLTQNEASKTIHFLQTNASYNFKLETCLDGCINNSEMTPYIHVTLVPGQYMYMYIIVMCTVMKCQQFSNIFS